VRLKKSSLIIFIFPYHHIGGAERVHLEITKSLDKKAIVFFDSYNYYTDHSFKKHAHCFFLNKRLKRKIALIFIFLMSKLYRVKIFGSNSRFFYELISKLPNTKIESIDLTHAFSTPEVGIETISLPYVQLIDTRILINNKTKNDYYRLYQENLIDEVFQNRFIVIPNGTEIHSWNSDVIQSRFNNFKIGFVGRNSPEKRVDLIFKIAKLCNATALIIGDNFDNFKSNFHNIEYFENCNNQKLVRERFDNISILVVPSLREGFPLVIMEAMELGIPVIATNVGNISEHVENNSNGFVFNVDESDFINEACEAIKKLRDNSEIYHRLSENARKYAVQNFDIKDFRIRYKKLLS
jgi:glycosyltransferase involved in cell wall biosynthesis